MALCQAHGRPACVCVWLAGSGRCFFCLRDSRAHPDNSLEWTVALYTILCPISPVAYGLLHHHIVEASAGGGHDPEQTDRILTISQLVIVHAICALVGRCLQSGLDIYFHRGAPVTFVKYK